MHRLTLRTATPADGATIARIQQVAWRATYGHLNPAMVDGLDLDRTAGNWAAAALDPARRLRLADHDGTTVGYAYSGPAEGEPSGVGGLNAVYLLPSAHGLGAGRLLVDDALAALAASGSVHCVLWVATANPHAPGFYEHLGFRPAGHQDTWRGLDVTRYHKDLRPGPC